MMVALDAGADDITTEDGAFVIYTAPDMLHACVKAFEAAGYKIASSESEYIPNNTIELSGDAAASIEKLTDALEDLDDVQNVYNNAEIQ